MAVGTSDCPDPKTTCVNSDININIKCLEDQQAKCDKYGDTLQDQINYLNGQISLNQLNIKKTTQKIGDLETEIASISGKIEKMEVSLSTVINVLISRVIATYKIGSGEYLSLILSSNGFSDFLIRAKYIRSVQEHDKKLLFQMQETKNNYVDQKAEREKKKKELDGFKITLVQQKTNMENQQQAKRKLLEETNNNEATYQNLLIKARDEYLAIQGIIAGSGSETEIRQVAKGETIAYIIQGVSCNSSGGHLHFIVQDNSSVVNPFGYLKSIDNRNCSGSSCGSGDGDSFNPSGNWDWPLNPPIELEQGYGSTWGVRNTWVGKIYSFHNGIDINGSSSSVVAVADGTLFKGGYAVGCTLSYVKLVHKDSNVITFYLHTYSN